MKLRGIVTLVAVLAFCTGTASAQTIGVYFDQAGTDCGDPLPNGPDRTFYILAILGGGASTGLQVAEARLIGHGFNGGGWFGSCDGNPASIGELGDGVENNGSTISFNECQTVSPVLLWTCVFFQSNNPQPDGTMSITGANPPSNPGFPCQHMGRCPDSVQICSEGGSAEYGPNAADNPCAVAVEEATWSKVKGIFSN